MDPCYGPYELKFDKIAILKYLSRLSAFLG